MSKDNELRDLLDNTASQISRLANNPRTWLTWMVYLLNRLEQQATNMDASNKALYKDMLTTLQDEIRNRLKTGGW